MSNILSSVLRKGKERVTESLPKVGSVIGDTFSKFKEIGNAWWKKTVSERAKTYYGKGREETKSDFTYFNMSSLKEAFKTIWTKPKALLWDPLKGLTVATAMTLGGAALSSIPNTAVAATKGIVAAGTGALGTTARIGEGVVKGGLGMADTAVSSIADKFDFTGGGSTPSAPKSDKPAEKKEEKKPEVKK